MNYAECVQTDNRVATSHVDSLLLDKLSKISKMYNISYDELCRTVISSDPPPSITTAKPSEKLPTPINEVQSVKTITKPSLDRFKFDYLKKTLKELKEIASKHHVSGTGTKEKVIERIYAVVYPEEKPVSTPVSNANGSASEDKERTNESLIQKCIDEKERTILPEKCEIGIDTSDLDLGTHYIQQLPLKTISPRVNKMELDENAAIFSKWSEIHDRDIILLLQTHQLPIQGVRRDWIQRLMDYYSKTPTPVNPKREVAIELINDEESLVSRIDVKPSFLKCISKAVPISFQQEKDERNGSVRLKRIPLQLSTIQHTKPDRMTRYVWVQEKNWVFREDESAYEFIGSIQDNYLMYMDIPYELLEMNDGSY